MNSAETPDETARRELKEELGCEVEIIRKIGVRAFKEKKIKMTYHWFLAKIKKGQTPQIGEPEMFDHFKYVPTKKLSDCKLSPNMKNFFHELTKGRILLF